MPRRCRRSWQFPSREDRNDCREICWRVSAARKPFAIAEEFGGAKIEDPARREISGLAARPGEETSAGCGLAQPRTSDGRVLRRVESLTHETTFQGTVDRKAAHPLAAASSRRAGLVNVRACSPAASERGSFASAQPVRCQARVINILVKAADSVWPTTALTRLTRGASPAVPHGRRAGGSRVEEDFPAAPKEPEANPWLPETYEHAGRPRGASAPSEKRAQEAHGERGKEVGSVSDKGRHEGLGRRDRLRARSCFLAAQRRGHRIPGRNLVVYVLSRPENERKERARIGITVSKKVGNAVVRNRVKRWLREGYRRLASPAPSGTDLVIIARPATADSTYQRTAKELGELVARAGVP
jgi:ribonuclease P protein component